MNYEKIIADVVQKVAFEIDAARWPNMSANRQRRYLKKHPNSEKTVLPGKSPTPKDKLRKKTKQQKHHRLKHMKHHNKINYDALHNV